MAVSLLCTMVGGPARAELRANFTVYEVTDLGDAEPVFDPWPLEAPDPIFRMAIFDDQSASTLDTCADGSSGGVSISYDDVSSPDNVLGGWNFTDHTLSKPIPARNGVYFYFGIFDDDVDASDLVGDHFTYRSTSDASPVWSWNNNLSPYYPGHHLNTVGGMGTEGLGYADNFRLRHRVWFTDSTGPVAPGTPRHWDDGLADSGYDNDAVLNYTWNLAGDPETGIAGYGFYLWDNTAGAYVFSAVPAPSSGSMSLGSSGCDATFTPQHDHEYRFRVRAQNGSYPEITNATWGYADWSSLRVDLQTPVATIFDPPAESWFGGDFAVSFSDTDSGSGVDASACRWRVASNGITTRDWAFRGASGAVTVTVGSSAYARHQGAETCVVYGRCSDLARRTSVEVSRSYSIDWSADSISVLAALTQAGGAPISETEWTSDRDPYFVFSINAGDKYSPIAGYSWAIDADPDADTLEVGSGDSGSVQLAADSLAAGLHTFRVRPVDAVGNPGSIAVRTVRIDYTGDLIANLRAYDEPGGTAIAADAWQAVTDPYMTWDVVGSMSPVDGYSWAVGSAPAAEVDTADMGVGLTGLSESANTFDVRVVDEAGNVGPAASFSILVDSVGDAIASLSVLTEPAGAPIAESTWQTDDDVWVEWAAPTSTSPIVGFSWDVDAAPDVAVDGESEGFQIALPQGSSTIHVSAVDTAGNVGCAASFVVDVDGVAPAAPTIDAITDDTGAAADDGVTGDTTLLVSGTAEADGVLELFEGDTSLGTTFADAAGERTFDHSGTVLLDGQYSFTATATDAAGNTGPASAAFPVTVDTVDPTAPEVTAPASSTDTAPTWEWTTGVGGNGSFRHQIDAELPDGWIETTDASYTPDPPLAPATYTLYVQECDDAGNWSASGSGVVTVLPPLDESDTPFGGGCGPHAGGVGSLGLLLPFALAFAGLKWRAAKA